MKIVLLEVSFIFLMMGLGNMKPANFSSDDTALAIRLVSHTLTFCLINIQYEYYIFSLHSNYYEPHVVQLFLSISFPLLPEPLHSVPMFVLLFIHPNSTSLFSWLNQEFISFPVPVNHVIGSFNYVK